MNEIKIKVKFKKGLCYSQGINLVTNDYNSTKLVFEFDDNEGTKIFEMKDDEDNVILVDEIVNNELILVSHAVVTTKVNNVTYIKYTDDNDTIYWYDEDTEKLYDNEFVEVQNVDIDSLKKVTKDTSLFKKAGNYVFEISLYKDNSKLTSVADKLKVTEEQVVIDGEIVQTYTPMFDNLLSDLAGALQETDNIDIDVSKVDNTSTVTVTKKDGTEKNVEIYDGEKGDTGANGLDAKINGVNTLTIEAGDNITLDQEGNILTINSTGGGSGGTTDYSALTNKPSINNVTLSGNKTISDLGLQPAGNYVTDTDYATEIKAGLVRTDPEFLVFVQGTGSLGALCVSYDSYRDIYPSAFISKGTLEEVITGKGLIDSSYHDSTKQDIEDNTLTTVHKTIPTAINEVDSIAKGANQALSYVNYSAMVTAFNSLANNVYNTGQNVMIVTLQVPDLWISGIESTSQTYTYTTDEAFTTELNTNGYVQVGYYKLSALETQKVDLTNYVTNTDYATAEKGGTIRTSNASGLGISNGNLYAVTKAYNTYSSASGNMFIGKGTLENVITGKGLVSNTDYATYSNGGVIKVDGAFSTFITDGKLKCTLKTYGDYQNLSSYAFIGKATLENVITGKGLDLKQLSTFDSTKTQVLKNINGTLTWVDES